MARSAARAPTLSTRAAATTEPSSSVAYIRLSSTPNTRASTSCGAARCRSVIPATSTTVLATPTIPSSTADQILPVDAASTAIGAPQSIEPDAEGRRQAALPDEADRGRGSDQPADPERRQERAVARIADVEHLESEHDHEHVEGTCHERLRAEEPDQDA